MTVNLTIPIECGEDTCNSRREGLFRDCKYFTLTKVNREKYCSLFNEFLELQNDGIGWFTARCKQCKESEK